LRHYVHSLRQLPNHPLKGKIGSVLQVSHDATTTGIIEGLSHRDEKEREHNGQDCDGDQKFGEGEGEAEGSDWRLAISDW
jgi:hypothetical protein